MRGMRRAIAPSKGSRWRWLVGSSSQSRGGGGGRAPRAAGGARRGGGGRGRPRGGGGRVGFRANSFRGANPPPRHRHIVAGDVVQRALGKVERVGAHAHPLEPRRRRLVGG